MKKMTKKLMSLLMTAAMVFSLGVTVFGANDALQPSTGTLTIHKYLMPDVSQAANPNNGYEAGTNNNPSVPSTATALSGISFDVYKITIPTTGDNAGKVPKDGDYTVDSMTAATKLTSNSIEYALGTKTTLTTGEDGSVKSGNLAQGYYLVIEQASTKVASPAAPFVVAVPMTNPAGTGWIQNVHVYPKNESISIEKSSDKTSVNVGETVSWTIKASVPTDIAAAKKYNVTDALDSALTYTADSVVVTGLASSTATSGTELTATTHYTAAVDTNNKLTVTFTQDGRKELAKYKFVKVDFKTTVNSKILDKTNKTVANKAKVDYTNRYDQDKEIESSEVKVHTGTIVINKTDANDGKGVNVVGAQFKIASSLENAQNGRYLKKKADGTIVDYDETGYDSANEWVETTVKGTTDNDPAKASFAGLKDYTESGSTKTYKHYWLVEVQAPTGYNLLSSPVEVEFSASATEANAYTVTTNVKNTTDFTLPKTGGIGTILFTVCGIVLIGFAVIMLIACRRKKEIIE
jgi:fimbrial isopeptide formation D2 family protein/LPXTG-motif cell wall-anchored protein